MGWYSIPVLYTTFPNTVQYRLLYTTHHSWEGETYRTLNIIENYYELIRLCMVYIHHLVVCVLVIVELKIHIEQRVAQRRLQQQHHRTEPNEFQSTIKLLSILNWENQNKNQLSAYCLVFMYKRTWCYTPQRFKSNIEYFYLFYVFISLKPKPTTNSIENPFFYVSVC